MSEVNASPSKRRAQHSDDADAGGNEVAGAQKRRAFLQTMGQQLRELGNDGTSPQDNSRTTFGTSPGSHIRPASRSANVAATLAASQNIDTPESDAAPGEDDRLPAGAAKSASKWLWKPNEVHPVPQATGVTPILFEDLLDWSQTYFDLWHPAFPFLHAPAMIEHFQQIGRFGLQSLASSTQNVYAHIILRSIMSISVADRRQMNSTCKPLPSALVFRSFNDAIESVQLVLTEESSIISLQALVSVQLFLISMHRYNAAARLQGLAMRIIYQLGLHRCPNRLASLNAKEAELRKRLFWSTYCIDRHICIRLGTPLGIRSDEMDVCFPHDELHLETINDTAGHDDRLTLLEFLARHADIRGSIMQNRNKTAMRMIHNETDRLMEVEAQHTKWWNIVDEHLSDDERANEMLKPHQVTLIVLRFETVLALHRSILATSKKNSAYNAALQRCISASRSVINTLHKALKGFGAFDGSPGEHGYESTSLVWPSFTWAVWMSVFIILFAATEGQVPTDTALRLANKSIQILQHLALRGTSWPDASIVAIKNLTSRLQNQRSSSRSSTAAPRATGTSRSSSAILHTERNRETSLHAQQADPRRSGRATPRASMLPPSYHGNNDGSINDIDGFSFTGSHLPNISQPDVIDPTAHYLSGMGNFLGIAQQTSDNPIPNEEIMHLFNGEDMAYWLNTDLGHQGTSF